jgi:hypothetical protein
MHGRLLEDKFRTDIGVRKKITGAEDMEYIISDSGEHDYRVTIYCNDGTSKNRDFPREKVKIEAQYYQNFNLGATDSIKVKYQEIEKSSGFTKVQTTLFILALILMVCLILF